jgi:ribosome-binding factor A
MSYRVGGDVLYVRSSYGRRLRRDEQIGRPIQQGGTNINNNKVATRIVNKPEVKRDRPSAKSFVRAYEFQVRYRWR